MFISVVLPAPFSPSKPRISPGETLRSMWSLATRLPKRFVMPRSSSSTPVLLLVLPPTVTTVLRCRHAGAAPAAGVTQPGPGRHRGPAQPGLPLHRALGGRHDLAADDLLLDRLDLGLQAGRDLAGEVVVRGQRDAAVGQGADVGAALERAVGCREHRGLHRRLDALLHAGDEVLAVLRRADAAVGVHHIMLTFWVPAALSASWTAFAAPRPTPPATGKMMSAPSVMNCWVTVWPMVRLVKLLVNSPLWVCSFQPSTFTFLWCSRL